MNNTLAFLSIVMEMVKDFEKNVVEVANSCQVLEYDEDDNYLIGNDTGDKIWKRDEKNIINLLWDFNSRWVEHEKDVDFNWELKSHSYDNRFEFKLKVETETLTFIHDYEIEE